MPGNARAHEDETAVAALAAPTARCDRPESLSNLQRKIVAKSQEGMTPLIRFIHRTRTTHGLDVYETVAWLEQRRVARAACGIAIADAAAAAAE